MVIYKENNKSNNSIIQYLKLESKNKNILNDYNHIKEKKFNLSLLFKCNKSSKKT